ncbi:MAG TPA: LLM class flavin-dependent oxidoreductase [Pseudonocardiaceae bacterium]|nr:LLM class flavin-dependent oxidoreductase [Pseudonocardiaceae bacterium]
MKGFRFSYNIFGIHSRDDFAQNCRRAERQGYDTVFAADHLGVTAPFPALIAAAAATQRLRVGTLVLNAPFWNPTLLPAKSPPLMCSPVAGWNSDWAQAT